MILRATEIAALNAAKHQGLGEPVKILNDARKALLEYLESCKVTARIVNIRPFPGVELLPHSLGATEEEKVDIMMIAVDGHKTCSYGGNNIASFVAIGEKGAFFPMPAVRMFKIATSAEAAEYIDIEQSPTVNIKRVARACNTYIDNITVCILDRPRHQDLIKEVQQTGARIQLIQDGDISACIAAASGEKINLMMGYGGAIEGVLTAAAMKCLGGGFWGKLSYKTEEEENIVLEHGIEDLDRVYSLDDLVTSDQIAIAATGITDGTMLEGVQFYSDGATTHSFLLRGKTRTCRTLETRHVFDYKSVF